MVLKAMVTESRWEVSDYDVMVDCVRGSVGDCRDKERCEFFQKTSSDRISISLVLQTVWQSLEDFTFRSRCERGEIWRCCRRRGWIWKWCGVVVSKRQTVFGYLIGEEKKQSCQQEVYLGYRKVRVTVYSVKVCLWFARGNKGTAFSNS